MEEENNKKSKKVAIIISVIVVLLLIAGGVTRHGEYLVVPRHTLILLNYLSGNIQQTDIGFRVGFLSSGDNP